MKSVNRGLILRAAVLQLAVLLSVVGAQAQSQSSQKRLVQIDETTGELVEVTPAETAQVAPQAGIVILNNQKSTQSSGQTVIQDQPTNVIEDSPLTMSSAERRRRERQSMELQTEQKIVEKLEEARMDDERARGERLFNQGFGSGNNQPAQQQVAPQTVQVIQAPPHVVEVAPAHKEEPKVNVKEEIRAALDEMKPKETQKQTSFYVQGLVGIGEYPDAINVRGNVATGFSIGMVTPERLVAEGTFQFSEYDIEDMQAGYSYGLPPFKTLSQYNFSAAIKYQILGGKLRPVVGAIAGYTYRTYEDQQYFNMVSMGNVKSVSTNAFDVGALVGLDVQLTDSFALGFDLRWMKNIAYRENSDYQASFVYPRAGKAVEELNYYLGSLTGKFTF
ncbi:MAG: hypothetical protein J0L82_08080 [Deltaproteobacteria bacterium]|nr:hypothetical protein [Deltaproteobacteria bacterium]